MGRSQAELASLIGRNRASEVLNRIRPLTLDMIRTISTEWNLPIEALAAPYDLARAHA
jgi:HTH-type transcriptional regulator/antitoxin HigA